MNITHTMNDNDENDPMPFVRLATLTANVMHLLFEKQDRPEHEARNEKAKTGDSKEANPDQRSEKIARK